MKIDLPEETIVKHQSVRQERNPRKKRPSAVSVFYGALALLAVSTYSVAAISADAIGSYPDHPITMIVPFAPGGSTDIFARIVGEKLGQELGAPIIIANRGGAAGNVGVATAARAPHDGYTILFGTASIAIAPAVYKSLNYDALADLLPVALVGSCPPLVLVAPDGPANIKELVALLKEHPGKYSYAASGYASATHLVTEYFNRKVRVDSFVVPYTGAGPANQGMISKLHLYTFETASAAMPLVHSGLLRAIAIASDTRSSILPNVPTIAESDIAGVNGSTWNMVFVPTHTSPAIVTKLNLAINKVLSDPQVAKRLVSLAVEVTSNSTPESSQEFLKSEIRRWATIVKVTGIKSE
jgi:tripartite-type tricarboxylate transporter receptor subunit TctC